MASFLFQRFIVLPEWGRNNKDLRGEDEVAGK